MDEEKQAARRVRLTLRPDLADKLEEIADVLLIEPYQVGVIALSLGVRMLDISVINPISANIVKAMDRRLEDEVEEIRKDIA